MDRTRFTGFLIAVVLAVVPAVAAAGRGRGDIPNDRRAVASRAQPADLRRRGRATSSGCRQIGLAAWIDQQLHPSRIDDHAAEATLPPLDAAPGSRRSPKELRRFARRQVETLAVGQDPARRRTASGSSRKCWSISGSTTSTSSPARDARRTTCRSTSATSIRPHVLGHFRDLLGATAKSPAMLFYLDNWLSADPNGRVGDRAQQRSDQRVGARTRPTAAAPNSRRSATARSGARPQRELRPRAARAAHARRRRRLHAAGHRRGRARVHRLDDRSADGSFRFVPALHDAARRSCSATRSRPAAASTTARRVLDIVAAHPSTARHIAIELAQRFVSDEPPPALVDRAARASARPTATCARSCARSSPRRSSSPPDARREGQDAARVRGQRASRTTGARSRDARPLRAGAAAAGHAALHVPAADRLRRHGRRVGVGRRAGDPHELRARSIAPGNTRGASIGRAGIPEAMTLRRVAGLPAALERSMTSRRVFLKSGAMAMLSLGFAPSFLGRAAAAAAARRKLLIAIFQRGAVDGLNMVVPYGEADYYRLRPTIAIPQPGRDADGRDRSRRLLRPASRAWRRSSRSGTTTRWPSSTPADRPTPRARTSTRRTTWSRRRRA